MSRELLVSGAALKLRPFIAAFCAAFAGASHASAEPPQHYDVPTFSDEFEGAALDANVWTVDPNRPNVSVVDGKLTLTTRRQADGTWKTGNVWSAHTQRYGYWEARYAIGGDTGLNNSFWLNTPHGLMSEGGNAGGPQSIDRLEVDIQETHYPHELTMNLHDWAPSHRSLGATRKQVEDDLSKTFHTYAFEWRTDNTMNWYFDDMLVKTSSAAAVNSARNMIPMETLLSTLVLPGFAGPIGPKLDGTTMRVDWVRIYQKPGFTGTRDGNWNDPANWGPDGPPGINSAAIFNQSTSHAAISLGEDQSLREIYFDGADTPAFTFAPGKELHLGAISSPSGVGGITINTSVTRSQTFDCNIVAESDLVFGNYSRTPGVELKLNGSLDATPRGAELFFGNFAEQPITANGSIGGNVHRITKFMPGLLTLGAANYYRGVTDIRNGVVKVTADGALGSAGPEGATTVGKGATLALTQGVQYQTPEEVRITGGGAAGRTGALEVDDSTAVAFHGPIGLEHDATISSGASQGSLHLVGDIVNAGAGARSLTIQGTGVVKLSGQARYSGKTTIASGTLALDDAALASPLVDIRAGATLDASALADGTFEVADGQTLESAGAIVGNVKGNAGSSIHLNAGSDLRGNLVSNGCINGNGRVSGNLTVTSGGTLKLGVAVTTDLVSAAVSAKQDVRIRSSQPDSNQGNDSQLAVGPIGPESSFRSLVTFALNEIPQHATLVGDVVLSFTGSISDADSVSSSPITELYQLKRPFVEHEATWNSSAKGISWASPGGDLGELLATIPGADPSSWSQGDELVFTSEALTADVAANVANPNYSLALKTSSEGASARSFYWLASKETETQSGPTLSFSYLKSSASPGEALSVAGDYVQEAGATLEIAVDSVESAAHGLMKVAGTADLAGTIRISLPDDFTPQEGERLTVLTATNITDRGVSLAGDAKGIQLLFGRTKVELLFGAENRK